MIYSSPQQILINLLLITNYYALYMERGTLYPTQLHLNAQIPNFKESKTWLCIFQNVFSPCLLSWSMALPHWNPPRLSPSLTLHIQLMPRFCGLRSVPLPSHFSTPSPFTADSHSSLAASTTATLLPVCPSTAPTCRTKSFETRLWTCHFPM